MLEGLEFESEPGVLTTLLSKRLHYLHTNRAMKVIFIRSVPKFVWRESGKTTLCTSDRDSNLDLRVIVSQVYCKISALDHAATETGIINNLRQELPPSTDTVYRHRVYPRGITPQEIQGLQAVLGVTRTVAEYDDCAQVALCENAHWNALNILLGLVSCSVPIPLKAELLLTLAALARSPNTAATLWHSLEASQILTTVPSISSYQPRGVQKSSGVTLNGPVWKHKAEQLAKLLDDSQELVCSKGLLDR
ncbi:unnamed protein product [Timema podura]|uniref:Uncharacterized protein n=1 Tax=Timema podura TaxID=61482 RepID=A0ABN7P138_TIMPD|nr:unnamed protein product [Timema podura]